MKLTLAFVVAALAARPAEAGTANTIFMKEIDVEELIAQLEELSETVDHLRGRL